MRLLNLDIEFHQQLTFTHGRPRFEGDAANRTGFFSAQGDALYRGHRTDGVQSGLPNILLDFNRGHNLWRRGEVGARGGHGFKLQKA